MTSLKVLSAAAVMALLLPLAVPTASFAQDKGMGGVRGGGGAAIGGGGGGAAIGGGGMRMGGGGGGYAAGPGLGTKFGGGGGGAVIGGGGPRYSGGNWQGGGHVGGNRHYRPRGYGGYGFGTGLVIGGALGSSYGYYGSPGYGYYDDGYYDEPVVTVAPVGGDDVEYCRRTYRSYDVRSGTYLGYDGLRHACP
ncbi:MAG: BA14K family protein [Hyphomicrobium sp.]|nr:BA14K family protein [Hyphomicrobium sp.]